MVGLYSCVGLILGGLYTDIVIKARDACTGSIGLAIQLPAVLNQYLISFN